MTGGSTASVPCRRSGIWAYNLRILVGNTYWLVVTPIAVTQLVLFWNMATKTLFSPPRAAQTIELLAPILGAFLCAHALAPERDGVGELVFVRPVSIEKVLLLRLGIIFAFILALLTPAFIIYLAGMDDFPLGVTILASLPSMLVLSVLAMVLAGALRNPLLGFAMAAGFWTLDLILGGYFNPLVSLHSYADYLAGREMSEQWILNKLVLLALAVLLYLRQRKMLGTPASPRRWTGVVRVGVAVIAFAAVYVASGAAYKMAYGMTHEAELGYRARLWYQRQFGGYGPIPVARMFGRAFPLYVQAKPGRGSQLGDAGGQSLTARADIARMREIVERFPESAWADNAQFEIARARRRGSADRHWIVAAQQPGGTGSAVMRVREDVEGAAREYQVLVDRYPDSPFAPLALSERAAIAVQLLDFDMARGALERLVGKPAPGGESYQAGMSLSALYLREGDSRQALRAAETAAEAALWDVRAEALLRAALAAHQSEDEAAAGERYQRARAAARDAVERATRGEKTPSSIPKSDLFIRMNEVISTCDKFLAGRLRAPRALPPGTQVSGRIVANGAGIGPARVAIGRVPNRAGFPSPFTEGPAAGATTDSDGAFCLDPVPPGLYRVLAVAVPVSQHERDLRLAPLSLPVRVEDTPVALPSVAISTAPGQEVTARPPSSERDGRQRLQTRDGRQGAQERSGGRGGRRGSGSRGGRRGRR